MDKLEQQLIKVLEKALNIAEQSGDFVIEQAPLLLKEFYQWHIASRIMGSCSFIVPLILFIYFYKKAEWQNIEGNGFSEAMSVVLGMATIFTITFSIINIYNLVFIYVAPKLYLINYFIK